MCISPKKPNQNCQYTFHKDSIPTNLKLMKLLQTISKWAPDLTNKSAKGHIFCKLISTKEKSQQDSNW